MILIVAIVALCVLKYLEIGPFAGMSWWWITGLMFVAFIWFEFLERMLGLDKRKAHDEYEKRKNERVKKAFEQNNRKR